MDQVWDYSENFLAVTNEADYFRGTHLTLQQRSDWHRSKNNPI